MKFRFCRWEPRPGLISISGVHSPLIPWTALLAWGLVLAWGGFLVGRVYAAEELTPQQRRQLEGRSLELNQQAYKLYQAGRYAPAIKLLQQALAMTELLYPREKYPQGHLNLATCLNNLASLLKAQGEHARALGYNLQALAMLERLYPKEKYPHGNPNLVNTLNDMGFLLQSQGEYARAMGYLQQALAMTERFYPREKYPQGHPELARSLNAMGFLLHSHGEYARALGYYQKALAMREGLYSKEKYPQGHPELATSLSNLGALLQAQGEYARALEYKRQALAMDERLYPRKKYPQGHSYLATSLNNLAFLLQVKGEYAHALGYYQQALAMDERLYPRKKYPQGHPELANSLHNLGALLDAQGEYPRARGYYQKALAMFERLYPREKYPPGHSDLATSLNNLGVLLHAQGDYAHALEYAQKALAMYQDLAEAFAQAAAEAEAFSYLARQPLSRDVLLSISGHLPDTAAGTYPFVWRGKAAITHLLERRHQAVRQALDSPTLSPEQRREIGQTWEQFLDTRRALARLLLAPPSKDPEVHRQRLQQLSQQKMDLEQKVAKLLPDFGRRQALQRQGTEALISKLPRDAICIDLLRYTRFDQDPKVRGRKGEQRTACYVAFVLRRGQPVKRVDLGQAAPIEEALKEWRAEIQERKTGKAAQRLRQRLWAPLAPYVPPGTRTVFLAPDAALTRLPWAALPVNKEGRVLLEEYAVAVVPHGPYLLERLSDPPREGQSTASLLAVGGVNYDDQPQKVERPDMVASNRSAVLGQRKIIWPALPGSKKELDQVAGLAGDRPVRRLSGAEASTTRLVAELPRARWVHLATHGFFADAKFRSALQIDEKLFDRFAFRSGPAPGARNPLVLSGLVLAGTNRPLPEDLRERTQSDGGILTAEAIAGLPLGNLDLAVLSACETGLGEVAGGEGVFGLQRAFHLAGTKNVIASLWKVDDQATAALMALFYDKLWRQKLPPIEALRQAQLTLYRHPERIGALAQSRGPNFDKVVRLPATAAKEGPRSETKGKASVKLWAGFVLSGLGR